MIHISVDLASYTLSTDAEISTFGLTRAILVLIARV